LRSAIGVSQVIVNEPDHHVEVGKPERVNN